MKPVSRKYQNVYFFNTILKLCILLGVAAPRKKCVLHRYFVVIVIGFYIFFFIYIEWGKQSDPVFKGFNNILKMVDDMSIIFLILTCFSATVNNTILNKKKFHKLLTDFLHFDKHIKVIIVMRKKYWVVLISFHIVYIIMVTTDSYVWLSTGGYYFYRYYFARNYLYYVQQMLIFFYIWLALEISNRFQILNNLFENQFSLKMQSPIYSTHTHSAYKKMNLLKEISHIRIFHDHLCEMVVAMNDIFGFVILFAVLFSLAFTLEYLIILILYVIMKHLLNGKEILIEVKYASIMWILENCVSK